MTRVIDHKYVLKPSSYTLQDFVSLRTFTYVRIVVHLIYTSIAKKFPTTVSSIAHKYNLKTSFSIQNVPSLF